MSAIKSANTKPEILLRKLLFKAGYRYRLNAKHLPGKPDIALRKYKTVIFVHGCFWHAHGCKLSNIPKSNADYWLAKIKRNLERDNTNIIALNAAGWKVLIIWECALVKAGRLEDQNLLSEIQEFFKNKKLGFSIKGISKKDSVSILS